MTVAKSFSDLSRYVPNHLFLSLSTAQRETNREETNANKFVDMPRITSKYVRNRAAEEMRRFLRGRSLAYLPNNACLATDYTLRWLNAFPKDVEALSIGQILGDVTDQPELSEKCFEALGQLLEEKARREGILPPARASSSGDSQQQQTQTLTEQQQGELLTRLISPEVASKMVELQTLLSEADGSKNDSSSTPSLHSASGSNPFSSSSETLRVSPTISLNSIQRYLDAAGRGKVIDTVADAEAEEEVGGEGSSPKNAIIQHRRVEILSPTDSPYGRGLFAAAPLRKGDVLFSEIPALHVTMPPPSPSSHSSSGKGGASTIARKVCGSCAKSLGSVPSSSIVRCRSDCSDVAYCSATCELKAYANYHGPVCGATNPQFRAWAEPMLLDYYGSSSSTVTTPKDQKAALTMFAVGMACALATTHQTHPLRFKPFGMLSGQVTYDRISALAHTGGIAVGLAAALRQEHLYLDDVMSLFALLMDNGFYSEGRDLGGSEGIATAPSALSVYPMLSMLNHSCVPNAAIADAPSNIQNQSYASSPSVDGTLNPSSGPASTLVKQLVVLKDILPGEQLFINYNSKLMGSGKHALKYEERKALLSQRHFSCTCPKCVLRQ